MITASGGLAQLDVIAPGFVTSLWACAGLAVLAVSMSITHHRRRRRTAAMTVFAMTLIVVAAADSVNAHYAYLPTMSDAGQILPWHQDWPRLDPSGRVDEPAIQTGNRDGVVMSLPLRADSVDGLPSTSNVVFLPGQYFTEPARRFPVVYLLHGSPGQPSDWFHGGRATQIARAVAARGTPAVIVAPQLSRSWTDDSECVDGANERIESHLFNVVIPAIDARLRTITDRAGRVFVGMSAGGFCALNLGLRHRNLVSTIIDLSGPTMPTHDGGAETLFGGRHNTAASALVAQNSPTRYLNTMTPPPMMRIWLDYGDDDPAIGRDLQALDGQLKNRGFQTQLHVRHGGHTYRVWTAALRQALPWALSDTSPAS